MFSLIHRKFLGFISIFIFVENTFKTLYGHTVQCILVSDKGDTPYHTSVLNQTFFSFDILVYRTSPNFKVKTTENSTVTGISENSVL